MPGQIGEATEPKRLQVAAWAEWSGQGPAVFFGKFLSIRAASARKQDQGDEVCSVARQQERLFSGKPGHSKNQSGYANPLNKATQPTKASINCEHRKSQEKSMAYFDNLLVRFGRIGGGTKGSGE